MLKWIQQKLCSHELLVADLQPEAIGVSCVCRKCNKKLYALYGLALSGRFVGGK